MTLIHPASDHLIAVSADGRILRVALTLDQLFAAEDPSALLQSRLAASPPAALPARPGKLLQSQEVWAAGVTYLRSMAARKEESKAAGGGTFYDKVYHAERPELFSRPRLIASWRPANPCAFGAIRTGTCPSRN